MIIPPPLPQPLTHYDPRWASNLVRKLDQFFKSIPGDFEAQSRLISRSGRRVDVTLVTATPYTVLKTDHFVDVNVAEATAVTLPVNPDLGEVYKITDSSGDASSNNITISAGAGLTVNGGASVTISTDYGSLVVYYNGSLWIAS